MLLKSGVISTLLRIFVAALILGLTCSLLMRLPRPDVSSDRGATRAVFVARQPALTVRADEEGEKVKRHETLALKNKNKVIGQTIQHNATRSLSCTSPKRHFMFSKIEKTGSSTLYGIFQRYVKTNKLNLMVQTVGYHLMTSQPKGAHPGWDIGPRRDELADVWIDHGAFNDTLVRNYMHPDTLLIACVREPVSWFKSATKYFSHTRQYSPDQLVNNDVEMYRDRVEIATYLHLNQLLWLGFDYSKRDDIEYLKSYVDFLVKRFNVIMLTDQFDASVVILRRRLCWSYSDMFYKNQIVTGGGRRASITNKNADKLLSDKLNLGEKILYDRFNKSWWSQPETKDPDFWKEVEYFRKTNKEVAGSCNRRSTFTIPASLYHEELTITKEACSLMTMSPIPMYVSTARYAIGKDYESW